MISRDLFKKLTLVYCDGKHYFIFCYHAYKLSGIIKILNTKSKLFGERLKNYRFAISSNHFNKLKMPR